MQRRQTIREQLLRYVDDAGMTQKDFCEAAGIADGQLSRFRSGERDLTLETVEKICKFLKLELKKTEEIRKK